MERKAAFLVLGNALIAGGSRLSASTTPRLARPAMRAIPMLSDAGFGFVVVAHAPGIALGDLSEEDLILVGRRLEEALAQLGATLTGFYYCPHHPSGKLPAYAVDCVCRPPQPGLITKAASELGFDLSASWVIAEVLDGVEAGRRAGCRTVLIDTGSEMDWRITRYRVPHYLTGDLAKAARVIVAAERKWPVETGGQQVS